MSEKITWTKEHSVGIREIDEQHKQFIAIANELLDLTQIKDISKELAQKALGKLVNYAMYHFSTEEEYFVKCRYGDADEHVAAHDRYREKIRKYLDRTKNEGEDMKMLIEEAVTSSGGWLLGHMLTMDKKYMKNFHDCGLE